MAWISFGASPCRGGGDLMTARVSMLLKSCGSLTCFRACFLPGRAKDLSAPRYYISLSFLPHLSRPLFLHPNYIWRGIQVTTSLLRKFSSASWYFIPFRPEYIIRTQFSNNLSLCCSISVRDPGKDNFSPSTLWRLYEVCSSSRSQLTPRPLYNKGNTPVLIE